MAITVQNSPFAPRKVDAASAARRRGMPASQTPTKDSNYQHAIIVHHSNQSSPTAKASP